MLGEGAHRIPIGYVEMMEVGGNASLYEYDEGATYVPCPSPVLFIMAPPVVRLPRPTNDLIVSEMQRVNLNH